MDFDRHIEAWHDRKKTDPFYQKVASQDLSQIRRTFRNRVWKGRAKTLGIYAVVIALFLLWLWGNSVTRPSITTVYLLAAGLAAGAVALLYACVQGLFKQTPMDVSMAEFHRLESRRFERKLRWYRNGLWMFLAPSLVLAYFLAIRRTSDPLQIAIILAIYAVVAALLYVPSLVRFRNEGLAIRDTLSACIEYHEDEPKP
jgi:hypothetical protein